MHNKSIYVLVGLLVVIGAVIALKNYRPWEQPENTNYRKSGTQLTPEQIDSITLTKGPNTLLMKKTETGWEHDGYRLNQALVSELLTGLLVPEQVEVVAESRDRHQELGLTETEWTTAVATGSGATVTYFLGKVDAGARYLNRAGEDVVYLIDGIVANEPILREWIDVTLASIAPETIERIQIEGGKAPTALRQTSEGWMQDGVEKKIDPTSVKELVDSLASFTAESVVTDQATLRTLPSKATLTVQISTKSGESTTYRFWKVADEYYVESSERKGTFKVSPGTYNDFATVTPQAID